MTKTERLVYLIRLLQNGKKYMINEIAVSCRTSRRTAYRDIKSLAEMSFPLVQDGSGGFQLKTGAEGENLEFTPLDYEILGYSLKCSLLNKLEVFDQIIRNLEAKLLSHRKKTKSGTLNSRITGRRVASKLLEKNEDQILKKFTFAMMSGQKIQVGLSSNGSEVTTCRPIRLEVSGRRILLHLRCNGSNKPMVLKPDEISKLTVLSQ